MTMMSVPVSNGALAAGTLEQALERFRDSSLKFGAKFGRLGEDCLDLRFRV
jgi:hypothetical protein